MSEDNKKPSLGGRPKGSPNKNSLVVRTAFNKMGFDVAIEWAKAVQEIQDPIARAQQLEKMMAYMYPKLKEVELSPSEILELENQDILELKPAEIPTELLLEQINTKK